MALGNTKAEFRFPTEEKPPVHPLPKPEIGRYHLVRFIRSDRKLNIFGEAFSLAPELQYEYVVATVDVKEQKLKIFRAIYRNSLSSGPHTAFIINLQRFIGLIFFFIRPRDHRTQVIDVFFNL
jgi:hypothetical protein